MNPQIDALVERYVRARVERERAEEELKRLRSIETEAELALFDALERYGLRAVVHEAYGHFRLNDQAWARITDLAAAREWAESQAPELITLNHQRLSVLVREFLRGERDELPPGVGYTTSRKIAWRGRSYAEAGTEEVDIDA